MATLSITDQQLAQLQTLVGTLATAKADEDAKTAAAATSAAAATAAVAQSTADTSAVTQAEAVTSTSLAAVQTFLGGLANQSVGG